MKKYVSLLLVFAMTLALTACGKKDPTPDGSQQTVGAEASTSAPAVRPDETPVGAGEDFVIGFNEDDMPFSFLNEQGELVGYSVDVARAACEYNNWNLIAKPIQWEQKDEILESGSMDCIWGQATESEYYNEETETIWLAFGEVYVDVSTLSTSEMESMEDLKGKLVEVDPEAAFVLDEENANQWAKQLQKNVKELRTADNAEAAYRDLFDGKCDAVIVNAVSDTKVDFDQFTSVADEDGYVLKTLYSSEDDETSETLYYHAIGACFAQYNDYFDALNEALYQISMNGSIQSMMEGWNDTPWGSLSNRFSVYEYNEDEEFDSEDEEDEDYGELTPEELEELFGDTSILEITDEDYLEDVQP